MFERCYIAAFAVGVMITVLTWPALRAMAVPAQAIVGNWYLPAITLIGVAIPLLLWYFIARRGSAVAKWIATVLFALSVIGSAISLVSGGYLLALGSLLGVARLALLAAAIWFIFRPDTRAWFGEKPEGGV